MMNSYAEQSDKTTASSNHQQSVQTEQPEAFDSQDNSTLGGKRLSVPHLNKREPKSSSSLIEALDTRVGYIDKHLIHLQQEIDQLSKDLAENAVPETGSKHVEPSRIFNVTQQRLSSPLSLTGPSASALPSQEIVSADSQPLSSESLNQGAVTTPANQQGSLIIVSNTAQGRIPISNVKSGKSAEAPLPTSSFMKSERVHAREHPQELRLLDTNWLVLLFTMCGIMIVVTSCVYFCQNRIDSLHKGSLKIKTKK